MKAAPVRGLVVSTRKHLGPETSKAVMHIMRKAGFWCKHKECCSSLACHPAQNTCCVLLLFRGPAACLGVSYELCPTNARQNAELQRPRRLRNQATFADLEKTWQHLLVPVCRRSAMKARFAKAMHNSKCHPSAVLYTIHKTRAHRRALKFLGLPAHSTTLLAPAPPRRVYGLDVGSKGCWVGR